MWTGDDLKPISMWDYVLFRLARIFPERSLHLTFSYLSSDVMLKETKQWDKNVKNLQELRDSSVDVTIPREKMTPPINWLHPSFIRGLKADKMSNSGAEVWPFPLAMNSAIKLAANLATSGATLTQSDKGATV